MTDETKKNGEAMPDEADDGLVILQDENGEDVPFEHLLTLDVNGKTYIVLEATRDMEDCLQGESILLRIDQDENGDDLYVTIEDEQEYTTVFERCLQAMDEEDLGTRFAHQCSAKDIGLIPISRVDRQILTPNRATSTIARLHGRRHPTP